MGSEDSLALVPEDVTEPADLVERIRGRREGGKLMNLDRMLLHSPPFAEGWNLLLGNVRSSMTALESRLLELAILVIACVNQAVYEFVHHTMPFLCACQDSAKAMDKLAFLERNLWMKDRSVADRILCEGEREDDLFDEEETLVIQIAVEMSKFDAAAEQREATINKLKQWRLLSRASSSSSAAVVELVGAISAYNMVSRFLIYTEGIVPESQEGAAAMIRKQIDEFNNKRL